MQTATREERSKSVKYSSIDWEKGESVKGFVDETTRLKDGWRYPYEKQWFVNISYILGFQNLIWSDPHRGMMAPAPMPHRARMVVNKLLGNLNTRKGKIVKKQPMWSVRPATSDDHDIQIARLCERVLKYYWQYLGMSVTYEDFIDWLFATGNAFFVLCWDKTKGPEFQITAEDYEDEQSDDEEQSEKIKKRAKEKYYKDNGNSYDRRTVNMGDLHVEAVGPFSVLWDERVKFKDTEWCVVSRMRDLAYAQEKWPDHKEEIKPDGHYANLNNVWESRISQLGGSSSNTGAIDVVESVVIHEVYLRPCKRYPNGKYAVVAGGVLTELGDNPYRMIPVVYAGELPVAGRSLATSTVEQCIPLQVDFNKTMSQLIENRNLTANPVTLLPEDSGIPASAWVSAPGKVWKYQTNEKGEKPSFLEPPSMPGYVQNHLSVLDKAFEDVTGVHEVSNARSPSSGASGYLVDLLIEQDDTRVGPIVHRIEKALGQLGMKMLQILHLYVAEPRLLAVVGQDHEYDTDAWFDGSELMGGSFGRPNVNYFDVHADISSELAESRAGKKEAVMALVNKAFLNPQDPKDKNFVLTALGVLGADNVMIDEIEFDRSKARDENRRMSEGEEIPVMPYENHLAEYDVHNRFRKTKEFNLWPAERQRAFHIHADTHRAYRDGEIPANQSVIPPMPQGQPAMPPQAGMGMPQPGAFPAEMMQGQAAPMMQVPPEMMIQGA